MHSRQDVRSRTSDCSLVSMLPSPSITLHQKPQTKIISFFLFFISPLSSKRVFKALSHVAFLKEHKFCRSYFLFIDKPVFGQKSRAVFRIVAHTFIE